LPAAGLPGFKTEVAAAKIRAALWLGIPSLAALLCTISALDARAEWPRIKPKVKARLVTIHKVIVLPAQVANKKVSFKGAE
jgi:hypothetical protein